MPDPAGLYDTFSGIRAEGAVRPRVAEAQDVFLHDLVATVRFFSRYIVERFSYFARGTF